MSINKITSPTSSESIAAKQWATNSSTATADQKVVGYKAQKAIDFANNTVNPDSEKLATAQKALSAGTGSQQSVDEAKYQLNADTQELHGLEQEFWQGKLKEDHNWVNSGGGQQATDALNGDTGAYNNFLNDPDYLQSTQAADGSESHSAQNFVNADISANGGTVSTAASSSTASAAANGAPANQDLPGMGQSSTPGATGASASATSSSTASSVSSASPGTGSIGDQFKNLEADYKAGKPIASDILSTAQSYLSQNPQATVGDFKNAVRENTTNLPTNDVDEVAANVAALFPGTQDSQPLAQGLQQQGVTSDYSASAANTQQSNTQFGANLQEAYARGGDLARGGDKGALAKGKQAGEDAISQTQQLKDAQGGTLTAAQQQRAQLAQAFLKGITDAGG